MSPKLDRRSRRALFYVIGFAVVTVLVVALGVLLWMEAPIPLSMEVVLELPPGGGELFVGGKSLGSSSTVRLNDADLLSLCETSLVSEAWPPPGQEAGGNWSSTKIQTSDYLVPPLVVGGDYVWHCRIANGKVKQRLALRFRAVDGAGRPLEAWRDPYLTQWSFGWFRAHTSHVLCFRPQGVR